MRGVFTREYSLPNMPREKIMSETGRPQFCVYKFCALVQTAKIIEDGVMEMNVSLYGFI